MKKPRILLSGKSNLQYYVDAVAASGGEPIAKYLPEVSTDYDGLILSGGNDTDPKFYHQPFLGAVDIDLGRDLAAELCHVQILHDKSVHTDGCRMTDQLHQLRQFPVRDQRI